MKNLSKSFFVLICCLVLNQKVVGQESSVEHQGKAEKILLESEIERALMNDKISRDDIQHCFKLMQAYADLSAPRNRERPTPPQVTPPEKDWINWVEFNTLLAAFLLIWLILEGKQIIERRQKHKRRKLARENDVSDSIEELWSNIHQINHYIEGIERIKNTDED